MRPLLVLVLAASTAGAASKLLVTVIEQKSGKAVVNLTAADFQVLEDKRTRNVESVEFVERPVDVMLLVDTGLAGEMVRPVAANLIEQLREKEQMAVVSYDSSAEMIQDFTSSRQLLMESLRKVRYGNAPQVLSALYAALDGGFEHATFRRVILLVTAGLDAGSGVREQEVIRLARKNGVSIYPVYATGMERGLFETLARNTGGASFNLRDMKKAGDQAPAKRIFEVVRAHYIVSVSGNMGFSERVKVEVKRPEKLQLSALPLD